MHDPTPKKRKCRRFPPIIVLCILVVCFRVSCRSPQGATVRGKSQYVRKPRMVTPPSREKRLVGDKDRLLSNPGPPIAAKPIVYTFYTREQHQPENADEQVESIGDDNHDEQDWIAAWGRAWSENGWQPQVLNTNDAKRHEAFGKWNSLMDDLSIRTEARYGVWKMLAMSVVGGGWLVNRDTFPLHTFNGKDLPNKGRMTFHMDEALSSHSQQHVIDSNAASLDDSSMVSGNAQEWYRLARAQFALQTDHESQQENSKNDMVDSTNNVDKEDMYEIMTSVVSGCDQEGIPCEETRDKYAIRFEKEPSHESAQASQMIAEWRTKCR